MKLSKKLRKKLYKHSMSMEEVIEKLKNITRPVLIEVIHEDYFYDDRTRCFYPNGYMEWEYDSYFNIGDPLNESCCFLDNAFGLDAFTIKNYKYEKLNPNDTIHKVNRMLAISAMLKYDFGGDLRIINIIET